MREIGEAIIGNLDDDGTLVATVEELASMGPWAIEDVERALSVIQGFDPVGVAARDLQECLLLQLRHHGHAGTPSERIVSEHMQLLKNHQVPELARKLGHVDRRAEAAHRADSASRSEARQPPQPVTVAVRDSRRLRREGRGRVRRAAQRGRAAAAADQSRVPPAARQGRRENTDETRAYVKDKFRSALWLIKSVEQRQKTIHKVATSIINFQRDFLDHGIEYLRPLVLRDVANDIGMHESTVSRVVTNKYMHTPQGVFEMKYFFHSGIASSYGEAVSSVTIKQRIRKIIEQEDPRKPLSDSKIVSILQREGLELARRTIAKYREELKIPTSNQRKVLYYAAHAPRTHRPSPLDHASGSQSRDEGAGTHASRAERQRRVGAGGADPRKGTASRRGHAARPRRTLPARRRHRPRRVGSDERGDGQDRSAGREAERQVGGAQAAQGARVPAGGSSRSTPTQDVRIIRARRYAVKPLSIDDAALEIGAAADAFLVFRNLATDAITVLFRRPDGHLGLIEPEA